MSMLNDLKKLLFGAKSVAKSAADKTVEAGKEAGKDLLDKSGDLLGKATEKAEQIGAVVIDKAEDIGQKIWSETEDFVAKARQYAEGVSSGGPKEEAGTEYNPPATEMPPANDEPEIPVTKVPEQPVASSETEMPPLSTEPEMAPPPNIAEKIGSKVGDAAVNVGEKAEDIAEQVGTKVLETAENLGTKALEASADLGEKLKGVSENIGETVIEKSGELYEKAKSFGENLLGKADELVEKAQRAAEAESNIDETTAKAKQLNDLLSTKVEESAPKGGPIDTKEGMLDKHDSFFDRAKRFAEGDYHNEGGRDTRLFSSNFDDASKNKKGGKAAGFEDLDGDGNELIDDAIVED